MPKSKCKHTLMTKAPKKGKTKMKYLRLDKIFALPPVFLIHSLMEYFVIKDMFSIGNSALHFNTHHCQLNKIPFETAQSSTFDTVLHVYMYIQPEGAARLQGLHSPFNHSIIDTHAYKSGKRCSARNDPH
jgi:hypothetical protein